VLFKELRGRSNDALLITEGLLIDLTTAEVGDLARDLQTDRFNARALDIVSPALLMMLRQEGGAQLSRAGAELRFAPKEGPQFFKRHGWQVTEVHSILKTADRPGRVPTPLKAAAADLDLAPDQAKDRPWSAVCLLRRFDASGTDIDLSAK
jgi:hypothetical protein